MRYEEERGERNKQRFSFFTAISKLGTSHRRSIPRWLAQLPFCSTLRFNVRFLVLFEIINPLVRLITPSTSAKFYRNFLCCS